MDTLPIAIIGCGGMGRRHLRGLATLQASDFNNVSPRSVTSIGRTPRTWRTRPSSCWEHDRRCASGLQT